MKFHSRSEGVSLPLMEPNSTVDRYIGDQGMSCIPKIRSPSPKRPLRPLLGLLFYPLRFSTFAALAILERLQPSGMVEARYGERAMSVGTVKWFNAQKGYGFIQPQGGGKDVFVHISAVERAGLSNLNEGQQVEYEEVANKGKTSAENLKVK